MISQLIYLASQSKTLRHYNLNFWVCSTTLFAVGSQLLTILILLLSLFLTTWTSNDEGKQTREKAWWLILIIIVQNIYALFATTITFWVFTLWYIQIEFWKNPMTFYFCIFFCFKIHPITVSIRISTEQNNSVLSCMKNYILSNSQCVIICCVL